MQKERKRESLGVRDWMKRVKDSSSIRESREIELRKRTTKPNHAEKKNDKT
jgi:hypothetical protein